MSKELLPKSYNETKKSLDNLICSIEYKNNMNDPLAYTLRNIEDRNGCSYKIVCSNDNSTLVPYLLTHEAGHVLLGHCNNLAVSDFLIKSRIEACWKKISHYFNNWNLDEVFNYFSNYIYNVSMDWEVNSKFLDLEEIEYMEDIINSNSGNDKSELLYPTRNNYPEKKSWTEYISYILSEPEKFFTNMTKNNQDNKDSKKGDQKSEKSNEQSGQENNQGNKKDEQKGGQENKKDKQENKDFSSLAEDEKKQIIKDFFDKIKKANEKKEKEEEAKQNDREQDNYYEDTDVPLSYSLNGDETNKISDNIEEYNSDNLEEQLLKCLKNKTTNKETKDIIYYYNRRKYGTNVLYTKNKSRRITKNNNSMCVLLDVSGSVDTNSLLKFVKAFKNVSEKLRKKCHLILWNTTLVAEYDDLANDNFSICSGGGTNMGSGLRYVENNPKYNSSSIIIVSDFEDHILEWKFNRKIYGICWDKGVFNSLIESEEKYKETIKDLFEKVFVQE